jgi:hypothetical protein
MSQSIKLVEVAYDDQGSTLAHVEAWGPTATATMQTVAAAGDEVAFVTMAESIATVATIRAEIKARIDAGSSSPVLKSHLDALGITAAVAQWAAL